MNRRFGITESHETDAHKKTGHAARSIWREENPPGQRYDQVATEFVCVDGEGVTLPDGTHRYVLLGVGDQQIENPDGLGWEECFEFLWSQFRTGSVAYTGFFLGYDFVQWLKTLPEERARMLLTAEGRAKRQPKNEQRVMPFPVRYEGWEFDILGTKRFRLRKEGSRRWMSICDTGPFFQKSFLKVIDPKEWSDPVVTQYEFDLISRGKESRSDAVLDDDMRRYNKLENGVLSRVLPRLNEGFQQLGIHLKPNQWFGPGQAASAWLKGRAITSEQLQECTPRPVLEAARASYYGGWFEIMAHGLVPGITWEYDINSAYPHVISSLPCLEHGKWINNAAATENSLTLVYTRISGNDNYLGAMLHRDGDGNISRPLSSEGWYWLHELRSAVRADLVAMPSRMAESWTYVPCDCPPPFREITDIYALRQKVGKKTPLGIACKLVPNSLYGKFAQSVGSPVYGNPVYASLITSGCRTMILDAIATHPGKSAAVLMVATDGVYFRSQHPSLDTGTGLGQWEETEKWDMCLFKPGVYWDAATRDMIQRGDAPVFKARGVNARDFGSQLAAIDAQFMHLAINRPTRIKWPSVRFPISFAMITAVQALQRNNWELAGTLVRDPSAVQSSDPSLKRRAWYWDGDLLRSRPPVNDPFEASVPYVKRFGMDDPWSQESSEMSGILPDGLPSSLIREIFQELHGCHLPSGMLR